MEKFQYDVQIIPVCIEYDRIFDSNYLSSDVRRGIFAPGTNIINVMNKVFKTRSENLGKCIVRFSEPINLENYVKDYFSRLGKTQIETYFDKNNN